MERQYGFKILSAVALFLAIVLATLAAVQFRWSLRIAESDSILARQRIESGAFAFAQFFDLAIRHAAAQAEAAGLAALHGGNARRLPPLVSDLYYLDAAGPRRLDSDSVFQPITLPLWARNAGCRSAVLPSVPAVVIPVRTPDDPLGTSGVCLLAKLDSIQLQVSLIPSLLDRAYGSLVRDYRFRVQPLNGAEPFFGSPFVPDFRQSLYSDAWELDAAQRGPSIASAVAESRRRALLASGATEALIVLAVCFVLIRVRSMLRIADKKVLFAGGLARELRVPVETLSAMARQQSSGAHGENEATRHFGELMHHQTERLRELMERAIEYSGIHARPRRHRLQEVDISQIIKATLAEQYPELALAGFEVEVAVSPVLPTVWGDPKWLRSAFENLLSNARKFAGDKRFIRVSAHYADDAKEVRISVEDRGLGIDAEDFDDIFEPFTRGRRAMAANVGGAGLGLSLVRGAAEAHHGSVSLVSQPESGSTFTMHLPA